MAVVEQPYPVPVSETSLLPVHSSSYIYCVCEKLINIKHKIVNYNFGDSDGNNIDDNDDNTISKLMAQILTVIMIKYDITSNGAGIYRILLNV